MIARVSVEVNLVPDTWIFSTLDRHYFLLETRGLWLNISPEKQFIAGRKRKQSKTLVQ